MCVSQGQLWVRVRNCVHVCCVVVQFVHGGAEMGFIPPVTQPVASCLSGASKHRKKPPGPCVI